MITRSIISILRRREMLVYLIFSSLCIYLVVAYYLCLTSEMPDLPDMEEEC